MESKERGVREREERGGNGEVDKTTSEESRTEGSERTKQADGFLEVFVSFVKIRPDQEEKKKILIRRLDLKKAIVK